MFEHVTLMICRIDSLTEEEKQQLFQYNCDYDAKIPHRIIATDSNIISSWVDIPRTLLEAKRRKDQGMLEDNVEQPSSSIIAPYKLYP